jgi:exonuclease III
MTEIYKIATLNINGLSSHIRIAMLGEFMRTHEIEIIFLQEVTQPMLDMIREYAAYINIGTNRRGTAFVTRERMPLTNIMPLPSGRGLTAELQEVWLVNTRTLEM